MILNTLGKKIREKAESLKRGKEKDISGDFYMPLLQDIKGFRDVWRNHVVHARRNYSIDKAERALLHVKSFMQVLASRVPEAQYED